MGIRNSSPPLSKPHLPQNFEVQPFPLSVLPRPDIPVGGPFCGTMGRLDRQPVGPLYRPKRVQDPIQVSSSPIGCSDKSESIFLPIIARRNRRISQETGSGNGSESGNSRFLFPGIHSAKKECKLRPVIDLSILNQYINKQHFNIETVKSVR